MGQAKEQEIYLQYGAVLAPPCLIYMKPKPKDLIFNLQTVPYQCEYT